MGCITPLDSLRHLDLQLILFQVIIFVFKNLNHNILEFIITIRLIQMSKFFGNKLKVLTKNKNKKLHTPT